MKTLLVVSIGALMLSSCSTAGSVKTAAEDASQALATAEETLAWVREKQEKLDAVVEARTDDVRQWAEEKAEEGSLFGQILAWLLGGGAAGGLLFRERLSGAIHKLGRRALGEHDRLPGGRADPRSETGSV